MPTFAHIETGRALDVQDADTIEFYRNIVAAQPDWKIIEVPEGTRAGATQDETGIWINPTAPALQARSMGSSEFAEYCYAALGALALPNGTAADQIKAGMVRRGAILLACQRTDDPATFEAYTRFLKADEYDLDAVIEFLTIIGPSGSGIVRQDEIDLIASGWPKG